MINPIFVHKDNPLEEKVYHVVYRRMLAGHMVSYTSKSLTLAREWIVKEVEYRKTAKAREIAEAEKREGEDRERLLEMIEGWYTEPEYDIIEEHITLKVIE